MPCLHFSHHLQWVEDLGDLHETIQPGKTGTGEDDKAFTNQHITVE